MKKILLVCVAVLSILNAQTFNVSTTFELRTALNDSAQNGEDDTIILANGTYKTSDDNRGRIEYLDNELFHLTIKGSSRDNVILDGESTDRIFRFRSVAGANLKIEGITFQNGGSILNGNGTNGGAINMESDGHSLVIENCKFSNNYADGYGGAIYNHYEDLNVSNTIFYSNASGYSGGGFYAGTVSVDNSTFTANSSVNSGGGFFASKGSIKNSTFTNNNTGEHSSGGGFYLGSTDDNSIISHVNFTENYAGRGAGFYLPSMGNRYEVMAVEYCTFHKNTAKYTGAGFYKSGSSDFIVRDSNFTENQVNYEGTSTGDGAAIYIYYG